MSASTVSYTTKSDAPEYGWFGHRSSKNVVGINRSLGHSFGSVYSILPTVDEILEVINQWREGTITVKGLFTKSSIESFLASHEFTYIRRTDKERYEEDDLYRIAGGSTIIHIRAIDYIAISIQNPSASAGYFRGWYKTTVVDNKLVTVACSAWEYDYVTPFGLSLFDSANHHLLNVCSTHGIPLSTVNSTRLEYERNLYADGTKKGSAAAEEFNRYGLLRISKKTWLKWFLISEAFGIHGAEHDVWKKGNNPDKVWALRESGTRDFEVVRSAVDNGIDTNLMTSLV